jgi:abortive infection alpha-like protein
LASGEQSNRSSNGPLDVLPAAARLAASAWLHAAERGVGASLELGSRVARAAIGHRESEAPGGQRPSADRPSAPGRHSEATRAGLRERGAELLAQSADVAHADELHPAYARILENLAPDEARILRLLATRGPQPAVDVRRGLPLVSELVAPGLTMIGAEAGCRYPDRMAAYLDNLNRLGLIWFSRETLRDINLYQVLEAQPEAVAAMREAGRTSRTVRRSIHLTPFGSDFCDACLPLDAPDEDGEPKSEEGSGETAG